MAKLADLLLDIRVDLRDTGNVLRWPDTSLYLWVKDALRDYSVYFPRRIGRKAMTIAGTSSALPTDYIQEIYVECPQDYYLGKRVPSPNVNFYENSRPTSYYTEGGYLFLNGAPLAGDVCYLTYYAYHPVPSGATDTSWTLTVPQMDEELIRLYVCAKAAEQIRTQQAGLDRFKLGSGDRQDNPLEPEVRNLMEEYRRRIAERFPGGSIRLQKPVRTR